MFTDARPDLVFHLAAILSARGEQNPRLAYDVNQTGTWNVLEACRRAKVGRLIFTSSIAVFGPPPSGPLPDPTPDDVALHPGDDVRRDEGLRRAALRLLPQALRHRLPRRALPRPDLGGDAGRWLVGLRAVHVRRRACARAATRRSRAPTRASRSCTCPTACARCSSSRSPIASKLTRTIYNIAAFSPRADEIADVGQARDPRREVHVLSPTRCARASSTAGRSRSTTRAARRDWGWKPKFDLDAMTDDLVPRVRRMLELGAILAPLDRGQGIALMQGAARRLLAADLDDLAVRHHDAIKRPREHGSMD